LELVSNRKPDTSKIGAFRSTDKLMAAYAYEFQIPNRFQIAMETQNEFMLGLRMGENEESNTT